MNPTPRLACEQCKQRKRRCNKEAPCSACKKNGLQCHIVQRTRLPRGRSGKGRAYNAMLENRVARIETLLAQQAGIPSPVCSDPETGQFSESYLSSSTGPENQTCPRLSNGKVSNFVAPEFWTALSDEICGLRETLENFDDHDGNGLEDGCVTDTEISDANHEPTSTGTIIFPHNSSIDEHRLVLPPLELRQKLLQLYQFRVDSVYKVLHWPTTVSMIDSKHGVFAVACGTQSVNCLQWSIYFMAVCSITESESEEMGLGPRPDVLRAYRCTVENLFAKSRLLQNPDLVVLQAFVIYLIGLRTCLNSADTWTLVAIAARAATALRLGYESVKTHSLFEIELRRRLLFAIGILDTHSALDRGTVPILPSTVFRNPPLRVNDIDMTPNHVPKTSSNGQTDMSHTAMIYEAMVCQRKLYELSESAHDNQENWQQRLELVDAFKSHVMNSLCAPDGSDDPLQKLQEISGNKIHSSLQLLLRRPPYHQSRHTVLPCDNFDVLDAATKVLEQHLQPMLPEFEPWAWKNWVQWHALAVVLAELTVRVEGPLSDRAYEVATRSFRYYARIVADSASGMLWKPIVKLMRRVQEVRKKACLNAAPAVTGVEAPVYGQTDSFVNPSNTDIIPDIDIFDSIDWNLDVEGLDTISNQKELPNFGFDEISDDNLSPWTVWDSFIHDINPQDT